MTSPATGSPTLLASDEWRKRRQAHIERVEERTAAHLERRARGQRHPVWDFLFDYYPITPGQLKHFTPGFEFALADATAEDIAHLKFFRLQHVNGTNTASGAMAGGKKDADEGGASEHGVDKATAVFDTQAYLNKRGKTVRYILDLLQQTASRPAHFDCFGLHEWAMVYHTDSPRHRDPLRLTPAQTDAVVDSHTIKCSHYDAYRFFTKDAVDKNTLRPTRATQPMCEQGGCLHANMDLYKWASKLGEIVPSEVLLDCFDLARRAREMDMRAAPYDLLEWGFTPIKIETSEGKAEYVALQRQIAADAAVLRAKLIGYAERVLATSSADV